MAEQLNLIKKENSVQNFLQFQMKTLESIPKEQNNKPMALLALDELFAFLEEHFEELYENENFNAIVPFIHSSLEEWSKNWDELSSDIGIILFYFLEKHSDDENETTIVVQIINAVVNFLKSIENKKVIKISRKVFMQLTEIWPTIKNIKLASEIISCLQLYIEMYPHNQRDIIKSLWSNLSQRLILQSSETVSIKRQINILVKFDDKFYEHNQNISEEPVTNAAIQQLLSSEQKDNRKTGQQMIRHLVNKLNNLSSCLLPSFHSQQIEELWTSYINILENMEEEAFAITPCLEKLKVIVESKQLEASWLEILYKKLLTFDNIDVSYWVMEFFLKTFTYSDLSSDIIEHLLQTSNSMFLYNKEGHFLKPELFNNFLKGDLTKLYEIMGDIEWKSIPLYIWIKALFDNEKEFSSTSITYEQILKLSSRIYNLECFTMRREIRQVFEQLIKTMINNMSMKEYIIYVETLYTTSDFYEDFEIFYSKISHLPETNDMEYIFSQRFYEIFIKNLPSMYFEVNRFVKFLNYIPKEQHGWLRFIPYHYYERLDNNSIQLLNTTYDIDTNNLEWCKLTEIIIKFEECLLTDLNTSDDQGELLVHSRLAAIAFYIEQKDSFDQEDEETLKIIFDPQISEYNNMRKLPLLWQKLCGCLQNTYKKLGTWIIDEFLNRICGKAVGNIILKYISKFYDDNTKNKYFEIILDKYPHNFSKYLHRYVNPLKLANQSRFFNSDLVKDEFRIGQLFFNFVNIH